MMRSPDVRYHSDAAGTASAERVAFPFLVTVRRPTFEVALSTARGVVAAMEAEAVGLRLGTIETHPLSIHWEWQGKGVVSLRLRCSLALQLPAGQAFWERAESVSRLLDLVQRHCEPSREAKDVEVAAEPAQNLPASPDASGPKAVVLLKG